jgi:all-trans-retinol 13,14-reductase
MSGNGSISSSTLNGARPSHSPDYDAIVIGSGLGGLTTGAYLTTNGLRTLVLEQYDVVGGCTHIFRRKLQWEFDVGIHYIGDCGHDGLIPTVLRGVALDDRIEFEPMDPDGFDTMLFPDLTFRVPAGWENYLERLVETFPNERVGLERCIATMKTIAEELHRTSAATGLTDLARFVVRNRTTVRHGSRSLGDLFDRCNLSQRAGAVLAGESGTYGLPPSRASLILHAALMDHYLRNGACYPKGGGQVFAAHLTDVIRTHGGSVRTQARVERILIRGEKVTGVQLSSGEQISAPVVVSNADLKRTMLELVGPDHLSARTLGRVRRYRMALPLFNVYLGVGVDLRERMPSTNYLTYSDYDIEAAYRTVSSGQLPEHMSAFITAASLKDPTNARLAPPGCSSLEIMTIVPAHHSFWGVGEGPAAGEKYRRNPTYLARKQEITERLIAEAERAIPALGESILWKEASTPITHERYTLASGGTSYGIELSPDQFGLKRPRPQTEIKGLYLAGASTRFGHGVAGVMYGGLGAAGAILGRDLRKEIEHGQVFADASKLTAGGPGWDPFEASRRMAVKPRSKHRRESDQSQVLGARR